MEDLFGDLAGGGEVERVLCVVQETHVYKIPPRQSSEGHRANDWNGNHLWTGRCRVVGKGDKCEIKLEEADGARTACAAAALLPTRRRSLCLQTGSNASRRMCADPALRGAQASCSRRAR